MWSTVIIDTRNRKRPMHRKARIIILMTSSARLISIRLLFSFLLSAMRKALLKSLKSPEEIRMGTASSRTNSRLGRSIKLWMDTEKVKMAVTKTIAMIETKYIRTLLLMCMFL